MRNSIKFALAAFAIVAAASCTKTVTPEFSAKSGLVPVSFNASIDDIATKVATLGDDLSVTWATGDSVAVYDRVSAVALKFTVSAVDGNQVTLDGLISEGATNVVAVYPYTAATSYTYNAEAGTDSLVITIPTTQVIPSGGNIDGKALVSVAKASVGENLAFHNEVSLVKVNVDVADVRSVQMAGLDGMAFIGKVSNKADGTVIAASTKLTIIPEEGALTAGSYYAAVAPVSFANGIKIASQAGNSLYVKSSSREAAFVKNAGLNLGSISTSATVIPETISTKAQLTDFAANANYYLASTTVKLGADIDLNGEEWTPAARYYGSFDGQNHRVYNLVTSSTTGDAGLFSRIGDGTNPFTISNLCVGSSDYDFSTKTGTYDGVSTITFGTTLAAVGDTYYYPSIIPYVYAYGTVDNVVNFVTTNVLNTCDCKHRVGGVVGTIKANVTLKDCLNFGVINNNSTTAGGSTTTGGISGAVDGNNCVVTNCENHGTINLTNGSYFNGGVFGQIAYIAALTNCKNYGKINYTKAPAGTSGLAGITGYVKGGVCTFKGCENRGDITIDLEGNLTVTIFLGGLFGTVTTASTWEDCANYGNVLFDVSGVISSSTAIGGVFARTSVTSGGHKIRNCDNHGSVRLTSQDKSTVDIYLGGVIGSIVTGAPNVFKGCDNSGAVTNDHSSTKTISVGGVAARIHQPTPFLECTNSGTITDNGTTATSFMGGVIAYNQSGSTSFNYLTNTGTIIYKATNSSSGNTGGVIGYSKNFSGKIGNCSNEGDIYCKTATLSKPANFGGVLGTAGTACTMKDCSNSGNIYAYDEAQMTNSNFKANSISPLAEASMTDCTNTGKIIVAPAE